MISTLHDSGPPLTTEDLDVAERCLGHALPLQYRAFLFAHNGGKLWSDAFRVKQSEGQYTERYLWFFLGIKTGRDYDDLVQTIQRIGRSLPTGLLPIAWDTMDGLICIATTGSNAGSTYLVEFDEASDDDLGPTNGDTYHLAGSLEEFLAGLYDSPPWNQ